MTRFRAFFLRYRALAFALIALALAMKALVPAGYMIGADAKVLTVRVCDGYADSDPGHAPGHVPGHVPSHAPGHAIVIAAKGAGHGDAGKSLHNQQACPFSVLALGQLDRADPILLALALGFIILPGLAPSPGATPRLLARLRPPLRAPPVLV